jgi:RNA polymerase sigma factor (sigma-70 family)
VITADEKRLIFLLQQDNTAAVEEIFARYHAALCQVSYRMVQDQDEAKDIVQEVFFKLWKNRKNLTIQSSLFAYLKRAVVNTSLNSLEKQKRFRACLNFAFGSENQQFLVLVGPPRQRILFQNSSAILK